MKVGACVHVFMYVPACGMRVCVVGVMDTRGRQGSSPWPDSVWWMVTTSAHPTLVNETPYLFWHRVAVGNPATPHTSSTLPEIHRHARARQRSSALIHIKLQTHENVSVYIFILTNTHTYLQIRTYTYTHIYSYPQRTDVHININRLTCAHNANESADNKKR